MGRRNVGILLFEDVEVLDFAGPYEVFSRTRLEPGVESRRSEDSAPFDVFTVAAEPGELRVTGGLRVVPDYGFATAPVIDVLLVPGGFGTRALLEDDTVVDWIRVRAAEAERVTSVCTGALLLASAGLLANRRATTHWAALDLLADVDASIDVTGEARVVEDDIVTSAGVSAGIDMALTVVERLHGRAVAEETARYMEYRWLPEGVLDD
ncbi:MAG: DJ-1/PfpI family protein [Gemmatimonadota bacterium]|nr:DJ-1/PfpI family protein [Gemmatimonadota bacterium]